MSVTHGETVVLFTMLGSPAANVVVAPAHAPGLVALSVAISILSAFAATELLVRLRHVRGRAWALGLVGTAVIDGVGTWSMHCTAQLALLLPSPLLLDWRVILLSLLVGTAGSAAALLFMGRGEPSWRRTIPAGVFLGGIGIAGLHYTAMAAIVQPRMLQYRSPALMTLSIVVEVVIACVCLPVAFRLCVSNWGNRLSRAGVSALIRGVANPAMHYTAMAGVVFVYTPAAPPLLHAVNIASIGVIGMSIVPAIVLIVTVTFSLFDRVHRDRIIFKRLFDQTPEAVAVTGENGQVIRVNRQFTELFGYTAEEAMGRRLEDLIGADVARASREANSRTPIDGLLRRKNGTRLHVDGVSVPVTATERYALMRDVTEQKRAEDALRRYRRRLIDSQEAERKRVARELHDEVGQMLTGISMSLSSLEGPQATIAETRRALRELAERVRGLALDLRPAMLDDFGLTRALLASMQRYERQTGIRVRFEHSNIGEQRFRPELEIAAYRIVQEGLTNVARHARATEAEVRISCDEEWLFVEVEDRGIGFDAAHLSPGSIGLAGMRERANAAGGDLTVMSQTGDGTRVSARLPLR